MNIKRKYGNDQPPSFNRPLNIRVSRDILDTVREAALLAQIPLSGWMRDRLLRVARREIRAAGHFPSIPKRNQSPRILSPRKERAMSAVAEAPARQVEKWITRFRKEFRIAVDGGEVVSVRMLRDAGGAKYEKFSFGEPNRLEPRVRKEIEE